jgi:hypothetical protein
LDKRLLGTWHGSGQVSGEWSLEVKPDPKQGIAGSKTSGRMTSGCKVEAEFNPDGTYTWAEQQQAEGTGTTRRITLTLRVPRKASESARWEVISARGKS